MAPKKHFNVDDAEDFDDGTRAVTYDTELRSSDESDDNENARLTSSRKQRLQRKQTKTREQASALRVQNWSEDAFDSAEYAGKVVSRKDIDAPGISNKDDDDAMQSPDEDAIDAWSDAEPFGASDSDEQSPHEDDDDNEDDDVEVSDASDSDAVDDEAQSAEKLMRTFAKADSAQLMSAKDTAKVVEKALHVRHQKILWERCLEVQIYTKRLLATTKVAAAASSDSGDTTANKAQAIAQLYDCIDAVAALETKLCNVTALTPLAPTTTNSNDSNSSSKKRPRSIDDVWRDVTASSASALPQYNDVLNTATRRTNVGGTNNNNQTKKFKAVNQDVLAQVESVLADAQRVKRKAHAPRDVATTTNGHTSGEDENESDQLDELMYDDADFYQQLLKEFLESGSSGAGGLSDALVPLQQRKKSKKKVVNRKASKGRALRFTVHPKLENFMFPDPYPRVEMDAEELFRSLFGHVTTDADER